MEKYLCVKTDKYTSELIWFRCSSHSLEIETGSYQHLIALGFNDKSTLVDHFVSSPREREKSEEIVKEMKEGDREETGTGMKGKKQKK